MSSPYTAHTAVILKCPSAVGIMLRLKIVGNAPLLGYSSAFPRDTPGLRGGPQKLGRVARV